MSFWSIHTKILAIVTVTLFCTSNNTYALMIDSFETPQALEATSSTPSVSSSVDGTGILGNERDVVVSKSSGPVNAKFEIAPSGTHWLSFGLGPATKGTAHLTWDGSDNNPLNDVFTGLGGIDLTDDNTSNALTVDVLFADLNVDLSVRVWTDANNASSAVLSLPGGTTSLTDVSVLFSAFSTTHGAGADFSNAGMVELAVNPTNAATDILVDNIYTEFVPEPSSLVLAGICLCSLLMINRRQGKERLYQ